MEILQCTRSLSVTAETSQTLVVPSLTSDRSIQAKDVLALTPSKKPPEHASRFGQRPKDRSKMSDE
jgi:hypothetical protein